MSRPKHPGSYGPEIYTVEIYRDPKTGVAIIETWHLNGKQYRVDGPQTIQRDAQTGNVTSEWWIRNNQFHREDGPACIDRDAVTGAIKRSHWYLNGKKIPRPGRSVRALTKRRPPSDEPGV